MRDPRVETVPVLSHRTAMSQSLAVLRLARPYDDGMTAEHYLLRVFLLAVLGWMNREEVAAVANDLGVSTESVLEMEQRLSAHDAAFDNQNDDEERPSPAAFLEDMRFEPSNAVEAQEWEAHTNAGLAEALASLDERSQIIVRERWLNDDKSTLQTLADRFEVSAERIRQLEKNAFKKLRTFLEPQS